MRCLRGECASVGDVPAWVVCVVYVFMCALFRLGVI